jgi:DNA primase (bacterial type)
MTVFEAARERLNTADVARRYGLELDRRNKARCCFHFPDAHPSLSFKGNRYKCFSCGASGDAISLVQHLMGLKRPIDAVKLLNADYGLGLDVDGKPDRAAQQRHENERITVKGFEEWERNACRVWAQTCYLLQFWKQNYAPDSPEEEFHPKYVCALKNLDWMDNLFHEVLIEGNFEDKVQFWKQYREDVELFDAYLSGKI